MIKILLKGVQKAADVATPIEGVEFIFKTNLFLPTLSKKSSDASVSRYTMSAEEKTKNRDEKKTMRVHGHLGVLKLVYANTESQYQSDRLLEGLDKSPSFYFALESGNIELAKSRLDIMVTNNDITALDKWLIVKYVDMLEG